MGLIRTILALIILLILVHVGLYYMDVRPGANQVVAAIYSLGALLESPATLLLSAAHRPGVFPSPPYSGASTFRAICQS